MSLPNVTWLLCTNSEDELLHRAINSCLDQTVTNFEFLIVTNGPEADLIRNSLVARYGNDHRFIIVSTPIQYLNFSLSLGLHLSRTKYVARMDSDDVCSPNRLELQCEFMDQNPNVAVLGSAYGLIDSNNNRHGCVSVPIHDEQIRYQLKYRNPICHPTVMLRRDAILSVGGYLGGRHAEDYDLWVRLSTDTNWNFGNLPDVLIHYNISQTGLSRRSRLGYANAAAAQFKSFLISGKTAWFFGLTFTVLKSVFRSSKP